MSDNPYLTGSQLEITEAGRRKLAGMVSDIDGDVYMITGMSPVMAAAAMARLSRNPHDMRKVILGEFVDQAGQDEKLLKRVISGYGDDSVQQLVGVQFVVENASNWLTKVLEWHRLGAYLEQSTRYIFFDQKDADGRYRYLVPEGLGSMTAPYEAALDQIFDLYSEMVRGVTEHVRTNVRPLKDGEPEGPWLAATRAQACDAVRPVLPTATTSTVGIFMSAQSVDTLIMHLLSEDMPEAVKTGEAILREARKVIPTFLERTDIPERGGATIAYKAQTRKSFDELADAVVEESGDPSVVDEAEVRLIDYYPINENEAIARMLFGATNLPLDDLQDIAHKMTKAEQMEVIKTYIGDRLGRRQRPGRAFEMPHYEWEVVGDYGTFRDIQRHRMVDDMRWQKLTPHLGFDVPELVSEAGFGVRYRTCFEISAKLYQQMYDTGLKEEAQYATLLGHRMRYSFITNLRELYHLLELRTGPTGHIGYRRICLKMHELLENVHPEFAAGMKFIGKDPDNDEDLTRMAAELATHDRLERLDQVLGEAS